MPDIEQYRELSLDDLIDLAAQICETGTYVTPPPQVIGELTSVVRAIKVRHDETAPARRRIGEYLRQLAIKEARPVYLGRQVDGSSYGPKPVEDEVDFLREDEYAGKAVLRLRDLRQLAPVLVRNTEAEFFAEQERRLEILMQHAGAKLPEKQKALLPCVAKGHLVSGYSGIYRSTSECCERVDGRTVNALVKKDFIGYRVEPGRGAGRGAVLMLKKLDSAED
jgi:hypothetical protein